MHKRMMIVVCAWIASSWGCAAREPERLPHQLAAALGGAPKVAPAAPPAPAPAASEPARTEAETAPAPEPGEDVLAQVKAWQDAPNPAPPTTFRSGHVSPRRLGNSAFKVEDGRFEVRMPSGAPITTPTAYDGKVIVSGGFHSKEIYAVEQKTGRFVWGLDLDDDGPSTAACADGACAFNTESCTLFVVDAATGAHRWSLWLGDPLTSAPAVADGRVFTSYPAPGHGAASHVIAAFDLKTGKILWQRWIDSDVMSAPVVSEGKVFATSFGGTLYRFAPDSGEVLSARRVRATSAPTVVAGDVLYSARADGHGEAAAEAVTIAKRNGQQRESAKRRAVYLDGEVQAKSAHASAGLMLDASNGFGGGAPANANPQAALGNIGKSNVSTMQAHQGSRALAMKDTVVAAMGDAVVCTDAATGKELWNMAVGGDLAGLGGALVTAPAAAGGSIFVGTVGGDVLRLEPSSGKELARWKVGGQVRSQPILHEGWIYVGTEDGRLVGLDTRAPEVTGWSTWGGDAARTGLAAR